MLKRVRLDWIEGVLNQSLYKIARMELNLELNPDAVEQPLNAIVQVPDRSPLPLPLGTTISDIFDAHAGSLLILGRPGTGKTTLLLELARELLNRAEQDASCPIPVVFNHSSWAVRQPPLADWLVVELNERSDVPRRVARRWVDAERIVPLLDGLTVRSGLEWALEYWLSLALCFGLAVSWPLFKPGSPVNAEGLILGMYYGLSCGLVFGMVAGGLFSLRHFVVRLTLWVNRSAPLDYVRFLDYATERLFLRKVGGGYIFIHRTVLEYFASLEKSGRSKTP